MQCYHPCGHLCGQPCYLSCDNPCEDHCLQAQQIWPCCEPEPQCYEIEQSDHEIEPTRYEPDSSACKHSARFCVLRDSCWYKGDTLCICDMTEEKCGAGGICRYNRFREHGICLPADGTYRIGYDIELCCETNRPVRLEFLLISGGRVQCSEIVIIDGCQSASRLAGSRTVNTGSEDGILMIRLLSPQCLTIECGYIIAAAVYTVPGKSDT